MTDTFATIGVVATEPRHVVTHEGLPITSFRLAATSRRYNKDARQWENGETNWFTVTAFRQLALNCATSLAKGERVLVTGRLRIRDWDNGERSGTIVEIDASSIGHDLTLGTSRYVRNVRSEPSQEEASIQFDPDERGGRGDDGAEADWGARSDSHAVTDGGAGVVESSEEASDRTPDVAEAVGAVPAGGLEDGAPPKLDVE